MMANMERNGICCILQCYFLSAGDRMKGLHEEVICVLSGCRTFDFGINNTFLSFAAGNSILKVVQLGTVSFIINAGHSFNTLSPHIFLSYFVVSAGSYVHIHT